MSSIYRKGRDGYFYYQSYIYNPNSGKKDKKIYHSLGTKNRLEAEKYKAKLDLKYSKNKIRKKFYILGSFSILTCFFIYLLYNYYSKKNNHQFSRDTKLYDVSLMDQDLKILPEEKSDYKDERSLSSIGKNLFNKKDSLIDTIGNFKTKTKDSSLLMKSNLKTAKVDYEIFKIEQISVSFDQWKIFVLIDSNYNDKELHRLCSMIKNDYNKYPNLIICVYHNFSSKSNIDEFISKNTNQLNDYWVAMYSYNPSEGEYFDGNPRSYLGQ